jgi:hypothetical protein
MSFKRTRALRSQKRAHFALVRNPDVTITPPCRTSSTATWRHSSIRCTIPPFTDPAMCGSAGPTRRLRGKLEPARDRARRAAGAADVSEHQSLLLHIGRRRGKRDRHQSGALVLEAARTSRQDEGHLTRARLSRHDAGRDERDGDCWILAAVRAARFWLHSHSSSVCQRARRRHRPRRRRHRCDVSRRARGSPTSPAQW